jgi:hypothetical protein
VDEGSSTSFAELEAKVGRACEHELDWRAKVAAGIYAALDFTLADADAARALTIEAGSSRPGASSGPNLTRHFGEMLTEVAPPSPRPAAANEAVVGSIVSVIGDHLRRNRLDRLAAAGPDLVHLALLPYVGFAEAKRWAQSTRVGLDQA